MLKQHHTSKTLQNVAMAPSAAQKQIDMTAKHWAYDYHSVRRNLTNQNTKRKY